MAERESETERDRRGRPLEEPRKSGSGSAKPLLSAGFLRLIREDKAGDPSKQATLFPGRGGRAPSTEAHSGVAAFGGPRHDNALTSHSAGAAAGQMGHIGGVARAVNCATKHRLDGTVKGMAIEWGPPGIRVNTPCPTLVHTPLPEQTLTNPAPLAWIEEKIRLGLIGEVEDIMGAVLYLASDASALVTGSSLRVDGSGRRAEPRAPVKKPKAPVQRVSARSGRGNEVPWPVSGWVTGAMALSSAAMPCSSAARSSSGIAARISLARVSTSPKTARNCARPSGVMA